MGMGLLLAGLGILLTAGVITLIVVLIVRACQRRKQRME